VLLHYVCSGERPHPPKNQANCDLFSSPSKISKQQIEHKTETIAAVNHIRSDLSMMSQEMSTMRQAKNKPIQIIHQTSHNYTTSTSSLSNQVIVIAENPHSPQHHTSMQVISKCLEALIFTFQRILHTSLIKYEQSHSCIDQLMTCWNHLIELPLRTEAYIAIGNTTLIMGLELRSVNPAQKGYIGGISLHVFFSTFYSDALQCR